MSISPQAYFTVSFCGAGIETLAGLLHVAEEEDLIRLGSPVGKLRGIACLAEADAEVQAWPRLQQFRLPQKRMEDGP